MVRQQALRFIVLTTVLALIGCADLGEGPTGSDAWAVYELSDPNLTSYQVRDVPLEDLHLAPTPLISIRDVRRYDWETHEIEFSSAMESLLDTMAVHRGSVEGVPFVVVVGKERIYLGSFWWAYSSMLPYCPYMEVFWPKPRQIQLEPLHQGPDPRADWRIYQALRGAGVLTGTHP